VRIIAGEHRGRVLVAPRGDTTRPITDRAKQSLFDVLSPLIPDAIVYDCFCGTGSMGLECLSRGAAHATFFDADRSALAGLKQNIDALKVADRARILAGDIFKLAEAIDVPADRRPTLIFLDPPYKFLVERPAPLQKLAQTLATRHAAPRQPRGPDDPGGAQTLLLFRHDTKDALSLPGWAQSDVRVYGSMTIELMHVQP
jgi:16S rRNA (guanine(966)-N(2))-methyltransferase RsmD